MESMRGNTLMSHDPSDGLSDKPGVSPANRSLERGIEILRAFRQGSELLVNGDIAERTGLSRSTVSRLTQTLVGVGMLQLDGAQRAYRLAPAVLSLAHAMRSGSSVLTVAAPRMRALAERERINVGLAAPDRDEMVYLESIRYSRRHAFRNVVSGQRVPMDLTSLGRAYLAVAPAPRRQALLALFRTRRASRWPGLAQEIADATRAVHDLGYCAASWQPEVVAIAAPLAIGPAIYCLNVSVSGGESKDEVVSRLADKLLNLRLDILGQLAGSGLC
jgi:DNA-binding IclR family transcriptional regulator